MDAIQILLAIVVVVLTSLLVIVGIQVMLVIIDVRRALHRLNSMLDDSVLGGMFSVGVRKSAKVR